jgi:hypothetical protein
MKKILLFTYMLFFTGLLLNAQSSFADNCIGTWKGVMYIFKSGIVKDSVSVRLTVGKHKDAGAWTWKTEYLSQKMPVTKDYVLRLKDAEKNTYVTDEGGGVELQDYLFGNKLYCVFETGSILLTSTYELKGNDLIFEVTAGKKIAAEKNELINYSVDNLQRVVFTRSK